MALIGKIRENSWLLIGFLALGMGGFLFMDMCSSSQRGGGSQSSIGTINGKKVYVNQFQNRERGFHGNNKGDSHQNREKFWNFLVEESLLNEEATANGIGVGPQELRALLDGNDPFFISPEIRQEFFNPQTGVFDKNQVTQILSNINDPQAYDSGVRSYWSELENRVIKTHLQGKLSAIVSKGMYTPTWMAQEYHAKEKTPVDFSYVKIPYSKITDGQVEVSNDEINTYLKNNATQYRTKEASTTLEYVTFDVKPSNADSLAYRNYLKELIPNFVTAENDSSYIIQNDGVYSTVFTQKSAFSPAIADTIFSAPIGSVIGPYLDKDEENYGYYRIAKVIDRQVVPDSVESRQILISVDNPATNPDGLRKAKATADSLINQLVNIKIPFDTLALQYGANAGKIDMRGPEGLLPAYRNHIFYKAQMNTWGTVVSQAGVHVVEVTKRIDRGATGARVAFISEIIVPSEDTQKDSYQKAFNFVGEHQSYKEMKAAALEKGYSIRKAYGLTPNGFDVEGLGAGNTARELVKWSHEANVNDVSPVVYTFEDEREFFSRAHAVAALIEKTPAGLPNAEAMKSVVSPIILNEKKAEMISSKIGGDLNKASTDYGVAVENATGVSLSSLGPLAGEMNVVSTAMSLQPGATSKAIAGKDGIYIVKLTNKGTATEASNIPQLRREVTGQMSRNVRSLVEGLKENAKIADNRSNFF